MTKITDLPFDELRRLQVAALRQLRSKHDSTIVNVGFGLKVRRGRRLRSLGLSARVFVHKKLVEPRESRAAALSRYHQDDIRQVKRPLKRRKIPKEIVVPLRRGKKTVHVGLATDVSSIGKFVPTSKRMEGPSDECSVGLVVCWDGSNWGFLTVGHVFRSDSGPIDSIRPLVEIADGLYLQARLAARSTFPSKVDTSVTRATLEALLQSGLVSDVHDRDFPRTRSQVISDCDNRRAAHIVPPGGVNERIELMDFLPSHPVDGLGNLEDLVLAGGPLNTFREGRSGCVWFVPDGIVGIQIAGEEPHFSRGLAQLVVKQREWASDKLGANSMSFVRVF